MSHQSTADLPARERILAYVAERRAWFLVLGVVLLLLGVAAVVFPILMTVAVKTLLGWLFMIGGLVQVLHAFSTQKWSGFAFDVLLGALYLAAGAYLAFVPMAGVVTLTLFLALMFIVQGVLEAIMALRIRPTKGWVWIMVSGLVALAVGVLIFVQLPSSAAWAIGLLAGINLISSGWAYLFLAMEAGRR